MADKSLTQELVGWIGDFLEWTRDTLNDDAARRAIVADLGGDPASAPGAPQYPPSGLASVKAYRDATDPDLEALASAIQDARAVFDVLRSFVASLNLGPANIVNEVFRDLLDLLALNYMRLRQPRLYFILQAVSFADEFSSVYGGEFNGIVGFGKAILGLLRFLFSPGSWFDQSNFDDEDGVRRLSDRTLLAFAGLTAFPSALAPIRLDSEFRALVPADDILYGWDLVPGVAGADKLKAADRAIARMLSLKFVQPGTGPSPQTRNLNTSFAFVPRTQGGPGLFVSLGGGYAADVALDPPWFVVFEMQANGAASVLVRKSRALQISAPDEGSDFHAGIGLEARPDPATGRAFDLKLLRGTHLALGLLRLEITLGKQAATLKASVRNSVLEIGPDLLDGFLGRLIPPDGLRLPFDLAAGLASDRGFFLEGQVPLLGAVSRADPRAARAEPPPLPPLPRSEATGPGLAVRIPIGRTLGPVTIHDLQLRVGEEGPAEARTFVASATTSLSARIGPVLARVDRLGVQLAVKLPDDPAQANLGLFDLDLGARFPDGVGVAIDAKGVVTGGGFLFHDRAQGLYAGVLQLALQERLDLKAFGLIATRLPDGSPGYSLIVFLTVEGFRPFPLGMGFTLQGIGGMVAIHRTFDSDAMREGLKNGTLGRLLFPKDPIRKAPEILRSLASVFPARTGSYLFGLLAKIGWATPTLVRMDLALIFEFGNRRRLILLGRISALLPTADNDLVRLNLDAFGEIDFDQGRATIDAVLVDSRLAKKFVLTGAMALRLRWGSGPGSGFALAVGGMNPRFALPVDMPRLERVTIALASGDNPRITCEAYFAITPNTLQFGARASVYAGAHGFSVQGDIGFDVLVQLLPFHFIADFQASVQLRRGSRNLFKVSLAGTLEGPRPLRVSAKASFEILWCDFSVRFDKTLVSGEKPPLPPGVDVLAELASALAAPTSWTTRRVPGRQHGVALRKLPAGPGLVLDPLGTLVVRQTVVPLNTTRDLDVFGGVPVAGARRFRLAAALGGATQQPIGVVRDLFAPAQFFEMSDDEKLAGPSFETFDAGLEFGSDAVSFDAAQAVAQPLEFETIVIDAQGASTRPADGRYPLSDLRQLQQARLAAVAKARVRATGAARFRVPGAAPVVTVAEPRWVVASVADAAAIASTPDDGPSWAETRAAMARLNRAGQGEAVQWQLVAQYEAL